MLKAMGRTNYHEFRVPYWDWRKEDEREGPFTRDRLGERSINSNGQPEVVGDLFTDWRTVCWYGGSAGVSNPFDSNFCDPSVDTGPLLRCPIVSGEDPCEASSPNWPSLDDYNTALEIQNYDTEDFGKNANDSFRNFLEGFEIVADCGEDDLCTANTQRHLHNSVSLCLYVYLCTYINNS